MKLNLGQTGQSLLEIAVAIGLVVIVATGITITTLNGLKNSQFSQNQLQATKYAQEGLERVRTIKDRNCPVYINVSGTPTAYYWSSGSTLIWNSIAAPGKVFKATLSPTCEIREVTASGIEVIDNNFTRKIILESTTLTSVKVKSLVSWSDASGTRSSELVTIIANY